MQVQDYEKDGGSLARQQFDIFQVYAFIIYEAMKKSGIDHLISTSGQGYEVSHSV